MWESASVDVEADWAKGRGTEHPIPQAEGSHIPELLDKHQLFSNVELQIFWSF
jgi:hypothetical protein